MVATFHRQPGFIYFSPALNQGLAAMTDEEHAYMNIYEYERKTRGKTHGVRVSEVGKGIKDKSCDIRQLM